MSDTGAFISILSIMVVFNTLLGYYAITQATGISDIQFESLPSDPGALDYIWIPFSWIGTIFSLTFFTIANVPAIVTALIIVMDITFGYILMRLLRGGG